MLPCQLELFLQEIRPQAKYHMLCFRADADGIVEFLHPFHLKHPPRNTVAWTYLACFISRSSEEHAAQKTGKEGLDPTCQRIVFQ